MTLAQINKFLRVISSANIDKGMDWKRRLKR